MCELLWDNIVDLHVKNAIKMLDPNFICPLLNLCLHPRIVRDYKEDYFRKILKDEPPAKRARHPNLNNTFRFLVFADPHIEYEYEEARE